MSAHGWFDGLTLNEQGNEDSVKSLYAHISSYLNGGRLLFLELENQIKSNCDIILDGRLTMDELAETIRLRLMQSRPN
jgi:hypothetical protein